MRRASVAEEIQVELDTLQSQTIFQSLFLEDLIAVFALGASGDLQAARDEVKTARQFRVIWMGNGVAEQSPAGDSPKVAPEE